MVRFYRPAAPKIGLLEIYGGIGLLLLFTARFVPLARWIPFWGCTLRKTTGLPCLSCGMTRSFDWFMQGRILDALLINPLGFVLAVLSVIGSVYLLAWKLRLPRLQFDISARAAKWIRIGAIAVLAFNWGYLLVRTLIGRMS